MRQLQNVQVSQNLYHKGRKVVLKRKRMSVERSLENQRENEGGGIETKDENKPGKARPRVRKNSPSDVRSTSESQERVLAEKCKSEGRGNRSELWHAGNEHPNSKGDSTY